MAAAAAEEPSGLRESFSAWAAFSMEMCIRDRNYGVHLNVALEDVKFQEGETCEAKWVDFPEFVRMAKAGELSPSLLSHLPGYRENFLKFIGQPDSALL